MSFICHIHNYTEYNQQWNVFSAFNPSKCTHTWSSWGFGALLKGFTSVVDSSCWSRDSNPQPRVTSLTLYPLEPRLPSPPITILLNLTVFSLLLFYRSSKEDRESQSLVPRVHLYPYVRWVKKLNKVENNLTTTPPPPPPPPRFL